MNDRELLEMAAKAAGIPVEWRNNPDEGGCECLANVFDGVFQDWWNPLEDDGDALRMATTLVVTAEQGKNVITVSAMPTEEEAYEDERGRILAVEVIPKGFQSHRGKLTRRAIVRAAAEIGKSMEVA